MIAFISLVPHLVIFQINFQKIRTPKSACLLQTGERENDIYQSSGATIPYYQAFQKQLLEHNVKFKNQNPHTFVLVVYWKIIYNKKKLYMRYNVHSKGIGFVSQSPLHLQNSVHFKCLDTIVFQNILCLGYSYFF